MTPKGGRVKPGWILLALLVVYGVAVTTMLAGARAELRELRLERTLAAQEAPPPPRAPDGLWFPVPGASLPNDDAFLPGAPRPYRSGTSQGFAFHADDVGVPITHGTPVIAATDATVQRVDHEYEEPAVQEWEALLEEVRDGADASQMDRLRGRQIWLRGDDGTVYRYAHLSQVGERLSVGDPVYRGQVIGAAGNSGTDDGVRGGRGGVRVHFEIWNGDVPFGEGMEPAAVRSEAAALFTGP